MRPASRYSKARARPARARRAGRRPTARPRATASRSPSSTSSGAARARSSATSTRASSTTCSRAWRRRSSTSAWSATASCTSTRSCSPDGQKAPRRGHGHGRRIDELIKPKQEVLVQVVKDPLKTKGARLSMQLSIAGRYLVYMPSGAGVGASRRLPDSERDRQRKLLQKLHDGDGRRDRPHRRPGRAQGGLRARPRLPAQAARGHGAPRRGGEGAGARLPGGRPLDPRRFATCCTKEFDARDHRRSEAAPAGDELLPAHRAGAGRVRRALRGRRAAARARGRRRGRFDPGAHRAAPTCPRAAT